MNLSLQILLTLVCLPVFLFAQTEFRTVADGPWEAVSTWQNGQVPAKIRKGDRIVIAHQLSTDLKNLTLPKSAELLLLDGSTLKHQQHLNLRLEASAIMRVAGNAQVEAETITLSGGSIFLGGQMLAKSLTLSHEVTLMALRGKIVLTEQLLQAGTNSTLQLGNGDLTVGSYRLETGKLIVNGGNLQIANNCEILVGGRYVLDRAQIWIGGDLTIHEAAYLDLDEASQLITNGKEAEKELALN